MIIITRTWTRNWYSADPLNFYYVWVSDATATLSSQLDSCAWHSPGQSHSLLLAGQREVVCGTDKYVFKSDRPFQSIWLSIPAGRLHLLGPKTQPPLVQGLFIISLIPHHISIADSARVSQNVASSIQSDMYVLTIHRLCVARTVKPSLIKEYIPTQILQYTYKQQIVNCTKIAFYPGFNGNIGTWQVPKAGSSSWVENFLTLAGVTKKELSLMKQVGLCVCVCEVELRIALLDMNLFDILFDAARPSAWFLPLAWYEQPATGGQLKP